MSTPIGRAARLDSQQRRGPTPEPDAELWLRLRLADEPAFADLFARHRDAVYTYAFRRTASWSVAEDATQATFTTLWRRARTGRIEPLRRESARPALLSMARDECANLNRAHRRQTILVDRAAAQGDSTATDDVADRHATEATMREIRTLLATLPTSQRELVELVAWADLTPTEAAEILHIPAGTAKSRLSRARARLVQAGGAALLHNSEHAQGGTS
jgi:RNA polymerase sigma-70 factor (ECF subfamily)